MAIESVNAASANNTAGPNEQAFDEAVNQAKANQNGSEISGQLIEGAMASFAPMLLMPLASKVLSQALSE
ncbi:hypothetical protein SAMN05661010_02725 [Modicisalibacter muralis]|uniref:Uncharacterized protein n=1 Tax=Modicisalibacter muralis TaxID=119000 RepID=A0A1G9NIU2_9GAMM|nr:hypothetical protein [Halomonas muralis]SDL86253.1 hypothetical protein SAMN05661010_02725 [Halomonas muralis]